MANLIFDVDGTIWNSTDVVADAWNRAIKETGYSNIVLTGELLKKEFGKPMNIIADDLFTDAAKDGDRSRLLELCCMYEHEYLAANKTDISYDGLLETFAELSVKHDIYIVSNCQKGYIELVLEKVGLGSFVKDFECFGNTGLPKGDSLKMLMRRNGITDEDSYYIGDTAGDKEASDNAGTGFIWAEYGFGEVNDYVYKISKPADLIRIFN